MHYRGSCRLVCNQGPELHLDLVGQQEPVLILNVSTLQGRVLHLDYLYYCTIESCAAAGLVYSREACAASGHVYTLGPELHMDMSSPQRPVPTYCPTCSLSFENNLLTVEKVRFNSNPGGCKKEH